ncbi:MAG: EpsG family protein, partial [Paramuribaculum sp.]|nr:EpsG family protein [Paramuribaculum sp.]
MGLRYRVGLDTLNYMEGYQDLPTFQTYELQNFILYRYEPGYLLLCMICKEIGNEFFLLQIFQSIILNTAVIYFFYMYCKNPFMALILYYYIIWPYFNTEILRESIAISIFILNYENLNKGKYLRYYIWTILAICFHFSAIILVLFPLFKNIKCNRYFFIAIII